jgi:hypothetical protein
MAVSLELHNTGDAEVGAETRALVDTLLATDREMAGVDRRLPRERQLGNEDLGTERI